MKMPISIGRVSRGTTLTRKGKIWLPQVTDKAFPKIEIIRDGGTGQTDDVTVDIFSWNFVWSTIRNGNPTFNITLSNANRKYKDVYKEGDVIKIYADWTDGTTQIFEAKMEEPRYGFESGFKIYLNGMKNPELIGKKISVNLTSAQANTAIETLFDEHFPGKFTYTNNSSDMIGQITLQDSGKPFLEIIKGILKKVEYDGYIDVNDDLHTFVDTGVLNSNEAIAQGINILSFPPIGKDTLKKRSRVTIYGAKVENCPIIRTKSSASTTWDRDEIRSEGNIKELDDAQERADGIYAELNDIRQEGQTTTIGLVTLRPGDKIQWRIPDCNVEGEYFIPVYGQSMSIDSGWKTEVDLNKSITTIPLLHFRPLNLLTGQKELDNINDMRNTIILELFNDTTGGSFSDCHISEGKLILNTGVSQGTFTSNVIAVSNSFDKSEVRGESNEDFFFGGSIIEVSNNGGVSYKTASNFKELKTFDSSNNQGRIKVTIKKSGTYDNPTLESIAMLINT